MHPTIARAHELIEKADAMLDDCAVRDATRRLDEPDALERWRSMMPEKERAVVKQKETPTELRIMALHAENQRLKRDAAEFRREVRQYRDEFEKAIGRVIANQRNELATALGQIEALRGEIEVLRATLPVRLVQQSQRTIGHAVGA